MSSSTTSNSSSSSGGWNCLATPPRHPCQCPCPCPWMLPVPVRTRRPWHTCPCMPVFPTTHLLDWHRPLALALAVALACVQLQHLTSRTPTRTHQARTTRLHRSALAVPPWTRIRLQQVLVRLAVEVQHWQVCNGPAVARPQGCGRVLSGAPPVPREHLHRDWRCQWHSHRDGPTRSLSS